MTQITTAHTDPETALPPALRMAVSDTIGSVRQQLRHRRSTLAVLHQDGASQPSMRGELGGSER